MGVIGWIIFGLVVGIVAKFLMPGRDPGGFVITAIIGIVGALLGGYLGRAIGWYREGDPVGFVVAVIGSIILLRALSDDGGASSAARVVTVRVFEHASGSEHHALRGAHAGRADRER